MRAITSGDLHLLTRYLAGVRPADRATAARRVIEQAHLADRYRKRLGRAHRVWGDGSLGAALPWAALAATGPFLSDRDHLEAMSDALRAILLWKDRNLTRSGFSGPWIDIMLDPEGQGRSAW